MKCTSNRVKLLCLGCIAAVFMGGCGSEVEISNPYPVYSTGIYKEAAGAEEFRLFSEELCVTSDVNFGTDQTDSSVAEAAGVFNLNSREVCYSQNLFEKLYPASTTKVLTAYIIIANSDLEEVVTVSEAAADQAADSSVCGLEAGDKITVRDLLYGLMLASGNDAAVALAEFYSGSVEAFAEEMNQVAKQFGATGSHFVNPHGLPDEDHYTTVYDMYLFMQHAVENETFTEIISTTQYEAHFTHADGTDATESWTNSNQYLAGEYDVPEGFTIVGGKTGTTNAAGYCLALFSYNADNDPIISIVYKADGRYDLYMLMSQILSKFGK